MQICLFQLSSQASLPLCTPASQIDNFFKVLSANMRGCFYKGLTRERSGQENRYWHTSIQSIPATVWASDSWKELVFQKKKKESRQIERGHMDTVCNRISGRGIFFFFFFNLSHRKGRTFNFLIKSSWSNQISHTGTLRETEATQSWKREAVPPSSGSAFA